MDSNIDAIDRAKAYENHKRVNEADGSEREKERKFAKALKEKMEDDLRRKKRHRDEVLLDGDDADQETPVESAPEDTVEPAEETESPGSEEDKQGVVDAESGHVDVKA